jgi:hypothetical protein
VSGPQVTLTPSKMAGGRLPLSPPCHQLPCLASFFNRMAALAYAVLLRHLSWIGWIHIYQRKGFLIVVEPWRR